MYLETSTKEMETEPTQEPLQRLRIGSVLRRLPSLGVGVLTGRLGDYQPLVITVLMDYLLQLTPEREHQT
jgi:hypothetical protein